MASDAKNTIAERLAFFDEAALEALANKGLVRRARKDLERGIPIQIGQETADGLHVTVADQHVVIPEAGPSKATCSCPARSVCQHILAACLFLRQQASASPAPATQALTDALRAELLAYTLADLTKWAGKRAVREAVAILRGNPQVVLEESGILTVRIPDLNIECRYGPSGGLDSLIVSGGTGDPAKHGVLALLAYQRAQGKVLELGDEEVAVLADASGAPRSRAEVLASAERLLDDAVHAGLSHVSVSLQQRAATLAVSALGVNLPRLSLALRGVADEIGLIVTRHAKASESNLLGTMARVHALCSALEAAGAEASHALVGQHRTQYDELGSLELHGLGAYCWRTRSGYDGLTVVFWDHAAKRWCTWSESRPRFHGGSYDPADRYRQDGPWEGAKCPEEVSRNHFKLMRAKRNGAGRLSGSTKSRALVLGPTEPASLDFGPCAFTSWAHLQAYAAQRVPMGLLDSTAQTDCVVLRPTAWGPCRFDAVTQVFALDLLDDSGASISVSLPFTEVNEAAIRYLEQLDLKAAGVWGILGRAARRGFALDIFPISLLSAAASGPAVRNPFFDGQDATTVPRQQADRPEDEEESDDAPETDVGDCAAGLAGTPLDLCLSALEEGIQLMAEGGCAHTSDLARGTINQAVERAKTLGLPLVSRAAERLVSPSGAVTAADVLRALYLCQLHRQAAHRLCQ